MKRKDETTPNKGLHGNARIKVTPIGKTSAQQKDFIIHFATEFYEFIHNTTGQEKLFTFFNYQTANVVSKTFCFEGFSEEEVYRLLMRYVGKMKKKEEYFRKKYPSKK